jgi:GntR family transcriptional repressor for pyruvate dehydrogenase complex
MFQQIKIKRISEEIEGQIKTAIIEGNLKPGQRLPPERELTKILGVSRISVREALKSLQGLGFVEIRRGGGCFVRSLLTDKLKDPLNLVIKENTRKIFDLMEVRKGVEAWSAYHAANRADENDLASIKGIIEEMKGYLTAEEAPPNRLDADFHLAISQASHNTIQSHLTFTIYDLFSAYFVFLTEKICFHQKYLETIYNQHLAILKAIEKRRAEEARDNMTEHLIFVEAELNRLVPSALASQT